MEYQDLINAGVILLIVGAICAMFYYKGYTNGFTEGQIKELKRIVDKRTVR